MQPTEAPVVLPYRGNERQRTSSPESYLLYKRSEFFRESRAVVTYIPRGFIGVSVAAHVRHENPIARICQQRHEPVPRICSSKKPMPEQDRRTVCIAANPVMKAYAVHAGRLTAETRYLLSSSHRVDTNSPRTFSGAQSSAVSAAKFS